MPWRAVSASRSSTQKWGGVVWGVVGRPGTEAALGGDGRDEEAGKGFFFLLLLFLLLSLREAWGLVVLVKREWSGVGWRRHAHTSHTHARTHRSE